MTEHDKPEDRFTSSPNFKWILYETDGPVATITLNEPERLNPIRYTDGEEGNIAEILKALKIADDDNGVRCVVITGAGRAFSSGGEGNISKLSSRFDPSTAEWINYYDNALFTKLEGLRNNHKPTIGAINGLCNAGALILALHLDILVASENATFCLMEGRVGLGGAEYLTYFVGAQWAKFMILSTEQITARKAKEIGLVLETFPAEIFYDKVKDLARRIASCPPHSMMINRRLLNGVMNATGWKALKEISLPYFAQLAMMLKDSATPDGRKFTDVMRDEGKNAFREMRDGPFRERWLNPDESPE